MLRSVRIGVAVHAVLFIVGFAGILVLAYPTFAQLSAKDAVQDSEIAALRSGIKDLKDEKATRESVVELYARVGRIEGFGLGLFSATLLGQGVSVVVSLRTHRVVKRNGG